MKRARSPQKLITPTQYASENPDRYFKINTKAELESLRKEQKEISGWMATKKSNDPDYMKKISEYNRIGLRIVTLERKLVTKKEYYNLSE